MIAEARYYARMMRDYCRRRSSVTGGPGPRFTREVEKTGLMSGKKHVFLFERYSGILQLDQAHPEKSSIQLDIEARSAVLKDDWVSAKA